MRLIRHNAAFLEIDVPSESYEVEFICAGKIGFFQVIFKTAPKNFLAGIGMHRFPLSRFKSDEKSNKLILDSKWLVNFKETDTIRFESDTKDYKVILWLSEIKTETLPKNQLNIFTK